LMPAQRVFRCGRDVEVSRQRDLAFAHTQRTQHTRSPWKTGRIEASPVSPPTHESEHSPTHESEYREAPHFDQQMPSENLTLERRYRSSGQHFAGLKKVA
jgi:hypothetical protein